MVTRCLFCSLCEVKRLLLPGEHFFAFLDDVCVVCMPERTRTVHDLLVWRERGFDSTLETRGCGTKQESASQEWDFPPEVKILRTPVGTEAFENVCVRRMHRRREVVERHPLDPRPAVRLAGVGPVCWFQVPPCFHHVSLTRKPHDAGMQRAMLSLLGELFGSAEQREVAWQLASLPLCMGG